MTLSTRQRLLEAARQLFGTCGYAATSVGDIEEAAGFTRRGGTLYRHFASKGDVLEAVIDEHVATVVETKRLREMLPLGDRRAEVLLVGRLLLRELDHQEGVHRLLDKDGDRAPGARRRMAEEVLHPGYRLMVEVFQTWLPSPPPVGFDAEAFVVVVLGGLVNLKRNQWTFGAVPLGVSEERALEVWADFTVAALEALG